MKAKMPGQLRTTNAEYTCIECDSCFQFVVGRPRCPYCGNTNQSDLVPVAMKYDELEEEMYTNDDFIGG